jgi:succinyl-CoA--D-citramalate CoA-transferase
MSGPLDGLKILDAGNLIAGPMAASLLGDYGAHVIKIEHPKKPDPLRGWEPRRDGRSLWWKMTGRNKQLITLNLGHAEGQRLFRRLVGWSDVVIENFRAGTFERWGLGYEQLAKENSDIILLRVSGYGQFGPYSQRPGYGTIAEAMSGIPAFTGMPDGPPTFLGFPLADSVAAVFGALAVMSAVYRRDRSTAPRRGQEIDLSLYEGLFRLAESQVVGYDQLRRIKKRVGNRMEEDAPRNAYATCDGGWVAISASSNETWERLARAIGRPELASDPRFSSGAQRVRNVEELDGLLSAWFRTMTTSDAMKTLEEHDAVAGPVMDIADIFTDPHYAARQTIVSVPDEHFGSIRMQGVVPKFLATPGEVRHAGNDPGHDNATVYREVLGLTDAEIDLLKSDGVI